MIKSGLYVVMTDPLVGYEKMTEICVKKNIPLLQLRMKEQTDRAFLKTAKKCSEITKGSKTLFIVNDRPDIALLSGADGVHLGQDDLPVDEIRKIAPHLLIGNSTHSLLQLKSAMKAGPDYVGFGPIYSTPTKKVPDPVIGLDDVPLSLSLASCPVVMIGGMFQHTIKEVLLRGAKLVAVVRAIMKSADPELEIDTLQKMIKEYTHDAN